MLYVTGITGHSGQWFLKRLEEEKYQGKIRCTMRKNQTDAPEKYTIFKNCNLDIEFTIGDLTDEAFLERSLSGVETILHTAGIGLSSLLLKAAMKNRVNWAILVHTTGRFSKYKSASAGYIAIEDDILHQRDALLRQYSEGEMREHGGINCTILRPTMIYGSSADQNMYRLVTYLSKHRLFPLFGDGSNLMQPVHARDLGNAYFDVLKHAGKTMNREYNLSGKSPITYIGIIRCIKELLQSKVKIISVPMGLSLWGAKMYNGIFGKKAIISVEQVLRMQEDKAFPHEGATKDFGYDPMSFEEGIKGEVDEFLNGIRVDYSGITYQ